MSSSNNSGLSGPNILVTGTPGTGKTTLCHLLAEKLPEMEVVEVGSLVKTHALHEGWNETFEAFDLDEDKLIDFMEPIMEGGNKIVDFHSCEIFPERWFHLVIVLRTSTESLYSRLMQRKYSEVKISENMECEIMQVVLESARESYEESIVQELRSDSVEEMESNAARIASWVQAWRQNNS